MIAIYDEVTDALAEAYKNSASRYNLRHKLTSYKIGEVVWRRNFQLSKAGAYFSVKLAPRFIRNMVLKVISPTVYALGA